MATPGALIGAIAAAFDVAEARIFAVHRSLREAGLIATGGRGTSAAKMTPTDAALVLIAAAGTQQVKDSPHVIDRQGRFTSWKGQWKLPFLPIPELQTLAPNHTFTEAVTALIEAAISGNLTRSVNNGEETEVDLLNDLAPGFLIQIKLTGPIPNASIQIARMASDDGDVYDVVKNQTETHGYSSYAPATGGTFPIFTVLTPGQISADLRYEYSFTHRSIMMVANLLRE